MFWQWLYNIFIALDKLGSALIGLDKDETISSVVGKLQARGVKSVWPLAIVLDLIFAAFEHEWGHCKRAIQQNEGFGSRAYDGALQPKHVIRYIIPLQIAGVWVFFNLDFVISKVTFWV